jgi:cytochrome c oxidase subunit 2
MPSCLCCEKHKGTKTQRHKDITMQEGFQFFPEQASTFAERVDTLYWFLIAVSGFFSALIVILIVFFAIKYRRRPGRHAEQTQTILALEVVWTIIPTILVLVMFIWGSVVYLDESVPPQGAQDIYVVGKQWMWKIQHTNGRREINELHVPVGRAVKLTLASEDVIHSFFIPAFRVKQDAVPGQYRTMWFEATKPGEYHLFCAEYCGTNHSRMIGRVVVMEDIAYQQWLGGYTEQTPVQEGQQLFVQFDCASCHETGRRQRAPQLGGLFGTQVPLTNGRTVVFDESYIRESIINPDAKVVQGFPPGIMPSFRRQLTEEQILALIAYIKSLSQPADQQPADQQPPGTQPAGRQPGQQQQPVQQQQGNPR